MEFSRQKIIEIIEKTLAKGEFNQVAFAESFHGPTRPPGGYSLPCNRITYVISGTLQLLVSHDNKIVQEEYQPGTLLVMKPLAVTAGVWHKCHETLGLVCHPEYLRIVHAVHDHPEEQLLQPTWYYHLKDSLRRCTSNVLNTLSLLPKDEANLLGPDLMRIALHLILNDLKNSQLDEYGRPHALWHQIIEYLANTNFEEQTRSQISRHFNVTETYVSRLFKKFSGLTFKEYVISERMKIALRLLEETNMSVEEIAWNSGFQSTSYFIRVFRQYYQASPGFWRRQKK